MASIAAAASVLSIRLLPPKLALRPLQEGAAVTHAAIRLPPRQRPLTTTAFETQGKRASLIGNVMTSPAVLDRVARLIGVDRGQVAATTEVDESLPVAFVEPDAERRANQILTSNTPYKLDIQARFAEPMLDIYAQAPSVEGATKLATASVTAANDYLRGVEGRGGRPGPGRVSLAQLGAARGAALNPTAPVEIATLTFLVAFAISFGLLILLAQVRLGWSRWRPAAPATQGAAHPPAEPVHPPAEPVARGRGMGDWPYTTRVLPWMIAGFIAMLWLMPINSITVEASLPIDLKLDRVVLPVIVLIWLFSLAAGGPGAPRWRFTAIHGALAPFIAVAFLSVVLHTTQLSHTLELELAIKKLTLLAAYFSMFLVVASAIRPTEVRAFMTLMLVMAVVCALGILWEYRLETNLFYEWSGRLLPGIFHVAAANTGYDEIGRRAVIGPADLGLEAVAMLSMSLPIGLVRLMHARRPRDRILYGLAVCVLLGGMLATYRKSALLAPISICLVLAYFRRHELLRLAPVGLLVLVSAPLLAPNALSSIVDQFQPNRLGVATVSDRVSDYDAVRPDLLSNLAFGRGFGSYEHTSYRILDNDLLMRIVETGLVGLAAFVAIFLLLIAGAAPLIRGRDPVRAPPALGVAAAATAFLVLSVLFDIMSFPNAPYLFMILAGLLAVVVGMDEARERFPSRGAAAARGSRNGRAPLPADRVDDPTPA